MVGLQGYPYFRKPPYEYVVIETPQFIEVMSFGPKKKAGQSCFTAMSNHGGHAQTMEGMHNWKALGSRMSLCFCCIPFGGKWAKRLSYKTSLSTSYTAGSPRLAIVL